MPSIEIDSQSGFCFGVVTAIRKAEEELVRGGTLYCLGDIVHNSDEVERLRKKGLETITHDDLEHLNGVRYFFAPTENRHRPTRLQIETISILLTQHALLCFDCSNVSKPSTTTLLRPTPR